MKQAGAICTLLISITASAQQPAAWRDTLRAAVITDSRRTELSPGHLQTGLEEMRAVVSPMGEGDPIRWAQGLPGVTTGADGTTVILQSGHWENGAAETYPLHVPGGVWMADYYSGVNNYHMPTVFRLDLGWQKSFRTGRVEHTVNVGVCNVTNHFNPFMLYFDTSTESWKEIALLPVLPNFSWRVEF